MLFAPKTFVPLPVTFATHADLPAIDSAEVISYQSPIGLFVALAYNGAFFEAAFTHDETTWLAGMQQNYPNATFTQGSSLLQQQVTQLFQPEVYPAANPIAILLSGTPFQLSVWQELLKLPFGQTVSYSDITEKLGDMGAIRAVGAAIGQNKLAFIVPCHRVITKDGKAHNFKWGLDTKKKLLGWESSL